MSENDGTCWNCKHYADNHDYAQGTCTKIKEDGNPVSLDSHTAPYCADSQVWLCVVHDFGCKLYEYEPYDKRGPHPKPLLPTSCQQGDPTSECGK